MPELANDIVRFTDGLRAARIANLDLDLGDGETNNLLTDQEIRELEQSKADSNLSIFGSLRLDAAFQVFRQTGAVSLAIEGLSFRLSGQRKLRQLTRRTILYLILIVVTAMACIAFFWFQLRPELEMIRADILATTPVQLVERYDGMVVLASLVVLLLVLCFLLRQLFGKTNWFTRFSGGQAYLDLGQQSLFWSITQRLVEAGRPISDATATAGRLLAIDAQEQSLPGGFACESPEQINSAKNMLEMLAGQKIESISNVFPTVAVVTVGGGCALICVLATFYPVVCLLDDLSKVAFS